MVFLERTRNLGGRKLVVTAPARGTVGKNFELSFA